MELIGKREFAKAALNEGSEIFVVHMVALKAEVSTHPTQVAQIAVLQWDKVSTKIFVEYADFSDLFSSDLAMELPENIGINKHVIELVEEKQLPYRSTYALNLVELETLKSSIETHLKIGFICSLKSPTSISILFNKKSDDSLCLYVNYPGLNNLIIKN